MGMSEKVFFIDDDENILKAFQRDFRKRFDLLTATGGQEALKHSFTNDPVAVVVCDMRMPGMDGLELLMRIRDISPDTVRIMLTGNSDQQTALNAINQGRIFRFYCKPCPTQTLAEGIEEGIEEYKQIVAEREILEQAFAPGGGGLTGMVIDSIIGLVRKVAKQNNGTLSVQELGAIGGEFKKNPGILNRIIQRAFDQYIISRDSQGGSHARNRPFDRVVVAKFADLFLQDDELADEPDGFSRRILPGFFAALGMMMGSDTINEKQEQCRRVYDRMKGTDEEEFDWDAFYANEEVREVTLDALIRISFHFNNWEKRSDWFINIINGHLGPDTCPNDPQGKPWSFSRQAFLTLMNSLLADLKSELQSESGRQAIIQRFGSTACDDLNEIFRRIDQAE